MKVGILTQPLRNNYGGLLQAYALQTVLKKMGYEAWIMNRNYSRPNLQTILKNHVKRFALKNALINSKLAVIPNLKEQSIIGQHTNYFKEKYIHPITPEIHTDKEMDALNRLGFSAYVVGSDQVWRPRYSPNITNYFLDFVKDNRNILKIAYAASFGVDYWEYSYDETIVCSNLAQKFNAISVRENSAVKLCNEHLNVPAIHVLDPTMLLNVEDYMSLIREENELKSEGNLMTYVLDHTDHKNEFINSVAEKLNIIQFTVMQKQIFSGRTKISDSIFPPVTKWLRGFMDADFIITDSFHGCAFAIIFNKPFIALGNIKRGIARFTSLLKLFDLENRLILDDFTFNARLIEDSIDWNKINAILKDERDISFNFLKNNLN